MIITITGKVSSVSIIKIYSTFFTSYFYKTQNFVKSRFKKFIEKLNISKMLFGYNK